MFQPWNASRRSGEGPVGLTTPELRGRVQPHTPIARPGPLEEPVGPGRTYQQANRPLVGYSTSEPPGTIVIDTRNTVLYLVMDGGKAVRYQIGVGREGFTWAGRERISRMAGLAAASRDARTRSPFAASHVRWIEQSAGSAGALSGQHTVPHPRHQRARIDWHIRILGLFPDAQPGRD